MYRTAGARADNTFCVIVFLPVFIVRLIPSAHLPAFRNTSICWPTYSGRSDVSMA